MGIQTKWQPHSRRERGNLASQQARTANLVPSQPASKPANQAASGASQPESTRGRPAGGLAIRAASGMPSHLIGWSKQLAARKLGMPNA